MRRKYNLDIWISIAGDVSQWLDCQWTFIRRQCYKATWHRCRSSDRPDWLYSRPMNQFSPMRAKAELYELQVNAMVTVQFNVCNWINSYWRMRIYSWLQYRELSRAQSCTRTFGDHGPSVLDPADGFGDPLGPITSQVGPFIEGDNCFLFTHAPCSSMGQHTDFSSFFTPPTFCFC